ncbi:hypothetical protein Pmar_PMAR005419 [Perkinsus marinus ATCC 50983]|uniref:Uncharacterized protein n=1 Tax=Perkinsus marinus (strain ATCC 50983 / TXsc) TaxID=423536 RepID=C5KBF0_PERM5|nr:hypothetical protein Pmar_PMAR005419 [Perkinsus marinus ATCC 50983]EER18476.1 hypothetical protein Pmar_PMAR005419 [Perkinsus marinus ATCC 50983]|eukprot:XP_002786680.1 hypothetical protein Pmar_PMAR005419 [Perkinsus marinus ATCC 50983]
MSEAASGLQEIIEVAGVNSLEARTHAMPGYLGLGPPDLCRLTKIPKGSRKSADKKGRPSYFHYVVGIDVGSASAISGYISNLISRQEGVGFLAGSAFKIESGIYCSWDIFHQCDVRVEVRPGGYPAVRAVMVDTDGNTVEEIGRSIWELSSWLRSIKPPIVPGLVVGVVCPIRGNLGNAEILPNFISLASKFITANSSFAGPSGSLSPTDIYAHEEEGDVGRLGTTIVTEVIADGFVRSRRLRLCPEVFNSLQSAVPHVMIHIARSYRRMGRLDACMSTLARCLHEIPADGHVLHYQAKTLLAIPDDPVAWELAITAARLATESIPMDPKVWATLAEAYRRTLNFEQALMALNNFPIEEDREVAWPGDETLPWSLGIPDVSRCQQTVPDKKHGSGTDPITGYLCHDPIRQTPTYEMLPRQQRGRGLDEKDRIVLGPGVGLNPELDERQRPVEDSGMAVGEHGQMTQYEARMYSVLVGICQDIGWDSLIVARSRVFIMDDDTTAGGAEGAQGVDLREVYRQRQQRLSGRTRSLSGNTEGQHLPLTATGRTTFRKRLCSKALEGLFRRLFVDLNESIKWQQEIVGGEAVPRKSCEMWCYLAGLAERLQSGDAALELACRMIQAHGFCPRASAKLLRLYTRRRMVKPAILQALGIIRVFQYRTGGQAPVPLWLLDQVADLVYTVGLSVVRQELMALRGQRTDVEGEEKGLEEVLEELVTMDVDGVGR